MSERVGGSEWMGEVLAPAHARGVVERWMSREWSASPQHTRGAKFLSMRHS